MASREYSTWNSRPSGEKVLERPCQQAHKSNLHELEIGPLDATICHSNIRACWYMKPLGRELTIFRSGDEHSHKIKNISNDAEGVGESKATRRVRSVVLQRCNLGRFCSIQTRNNS